MPFFRYSKFCAFQWLASIFLIIYGSVLYSKNINYGWIILLIGLLLFFFFPIINEICMYVWAHCFQKDFDIIETKHKFGI